MGYSDELKMVRRELKKSLGKAGVKARVRQASGSFNPYTYVDKPKGKKNWTSKEMKVLEKDFGINIGHPYNSGIVSEARIFSTVGGYKSKKFKSKPQYKKFKQDFLQEGYKADDSGTCCLGAGTVVKKGKMDIDWIQQLGMTDTRNIVAERMMENRAKKMGLSFKHESGVMD